MRDRRAERTGVTYGNMRAKLSDYIEQVFECKANRPHYSRKWRAHTGVTRLTRRARGMTLPGSQNAERPIEPFTQVSPVSRAHGLCAPFLDIAYPIT